MIDFRVAVAFSAASLVLGILYGMVILDQKVYTEKHNCEYVEKTECKNVWVKK